MLQIISTAICERWLTEYVMSFKCTCTQTLSCAPLICVRSHFCHHISLWSTNINKKIKCDTYAIIYYMFTIIYTLWFVLNVQLRVTKYTIPEFSFFIKIEDFFGFHFGNPSHFFCIIINMAQNCYFFVYDYVTSTMNHLVRAVFT